MNAEPVIVSTPMPSAPAVIIRDKKIGALSEMFSSGYSALLVDAVEAAIRHSFATNGMRNQTMDEAKRRAAICFDIVKTLRGDLSWGATRIADNLPRLLVDHLNGIDFNPESERSCWLPGDGSQP